MEQGVSEAWHASDLLQSVVEEGPGVAKCSIQRSPGFLDVLACFGHVLEGPALDQPDRTWAPCCLWQLQ